MAEEKFTNTLCRDIGHSWQATTAPNYRACTRSGCHAAQHLDHGIWITVTTRLRNRPGDTSPRLSAPGQSSLF
jgi:hypothetical protein